MCNYLHILNKKITFTSMENAIDKTQVLGIIKSHFEEKFQQLAIRPQHEQNVIGDLLTTLEIELKKDIKAL